MTWEREPSLWECGGEGAFLVGGGGSLPCGSVVGEGAFLVGVCVEFILRSF